MKSYLYIALLILIPTIAKAQQHYFVYIQTDNKQPFYIKMNDKLLSSSSSGYIVIPKLSNGNYSLNIGFPKDQWPQQNIALTINGADAGYLLKNFAEKGWGLYNIQTMQITMSGQPSLTPVKTTLDNDDMFANSLSGATNSNLSIKKDVTQVTTTTQVTNKPTQKSFINTIKKLETVNDVDGKTFIYTDENTDTIKIFFPVDVLQSTTNTTKPQYTEPIITSTVAETPKADKRFLDIDLQNPNAKANESVQTPSASLNKATSTQPTQEPIINVDVKSTPVVNINSDCKANANDDDFFKLRKKMAASSNDDDLINAANKYFKSKCFSVAQIKNLSTLFLTDNGKYKFFVASYSHVYDTQNFESLKAELTDSYFIKRFSDMLGK
ncbi:DUF4476 domain-containing protein [Ferruginibacter yonginensis]|uniref:DUF4476 domain-containing protein n=1 Tax=Ferruginibacter yonginensis TaxID=1310416 RepID=A0ABV8QXL6_9BACT